MARIIQYVHRPNMTELGMGNTHDRYLVGPEDKLKQLFPLGVDTEIVDVNTNKTYTIYSKYENSEFRIKLMGDICDDYQMEPGDEVIFTRYETKEGVRTTLQIVECGRIFLNPGRRENGTIKDFEIVNLEKLPCLNRESDYNCEYSFMGERHKIEIEFLETRKKRADSPFMTDFYEVKYNGNYLESRNSPMYYLCIRNKSVILKNLQKYEFTILLNEEEVGRGINNDKSLQQIFYGAPGTGKSHGIKDNDDVKSADAKNLVFRTTFHPDSDYSTFVGAYKPTMKPVADKYKAVAGKDEEIAYSFVPQAFLQAYVAAWNNPDEKVFLVIEEINRGNCAQIFGDLFQLLDRDEDGNSEYPIVADMDLAKYLSGKDENDQGVLKNKDGLKDGKLKLPKNLYIWATMNTSDQSLFPIDSAFKRRWDWKYMPIADGKKDWKIEVAKKQYDWWQFLQKINEQIGKTTNSEDKKLGYYFCKTKDGIIDAETFVGKVIFYLWNDVFKDFAEEAGCVFKDADDSVLSFNKFYTVGEDGKTKVVEEKVELFLRNLGVDAIDAIIDEVAALLDEDGEDVSNIGNRNFDYAKYSINGQGSYPKGRVAEKAISLFVSMNPDMSDEDIVDTWLKLNIKVPNLVETSQMFEARTASSSDPGLRSRYKTVQMPNGHILYVSNQYNVERINEFISKVNSQDWNIHIEKIAV